MLDNLVKSLDPIVKEWQNQTVFKDRECANLANSIKTVNWVKEEGDEFCFVLEYMGKHYCCSWGDPLDYEMQETGDSDEMPQPVKEYAVKLDTIIQTAHGRVGDVIEKLEEDKIIDSLIDYGEILGICVKDKDGFKWEYSVQPWTTDYAYAFQKALVSYWYAKFKAKKDESDEATHRLDKLGKYLTKNRVHFDNSSIRMDLWHIIMGGKK